MAKSSSGKLDNSLISVGKPERPVPQLSYWEQQWVRCCRLILGVVPPRRRGGMRRHRRALTCAGSNLRHILSLYGTPRVVAETVDVQYVDFSAEEVVEAPVVVVGCKFEAS